MSPPASNTPIPFSMDSYQESYTDDPLLDYCEDYVWDPSDWDLETEDSIGYWDLSDKDDFTTTTNNQDTIVRYIPPQPSKVSPLLQGIQDYNSKRGLIYAFLLKFDSVIKKALRFKIISTKWILFKWVCVVFNVVIEVCQATFSQENAQGKLSTPFYLKLSIITSGFCVMISVIETIREGMKSKVVWRKRGYFGWFYYPGRQRRPFGRFSLIFGVVSSMVQLWINLVALVINKKFLNFDTLPLLLSFGYLIAVMVDRGGKYMRNRKVHRRCLKQCSWCEAEVVNRPFGLGSSRINSGWSYSANSGDELFSSISHQFGSYSSRFSIKLL